MTILSLFIPGVPKNANARNQWARYAANRDRQHFRKLTADIAKPIVEGVPWYPPEFTQIVVRHISPVRRRRDPTGLAERLKGILDGLVDANILIDDDEDHVGITLAHSRKGKEAGISLTIFGTNPPDWN
jgi:hypothetical protein